MDIEQLKLVLETVKGVGDSTLTVIAIWLARDFILTLMGYGVGVFLIKKTAEVLTNLICLSGFHKQLMNEIGSSVYLDAADQEKIIQLVRKGKDAK